MPVTPLCMTDTMNQVESFISTVAICTMVPHAKQGTDDDTTKHTRTLAMICEQNNDHQTLGPISTLVAPQLMPFRTVRLVLPFPSLATAHKQPVAATRIHYSNYKAEYEALMMAISLAVDSQQKNTMAVCLTDARSFLQALTNNELPHLATSLQLLSNNCRVALQWIPAQCGVPGNKQADTLAKQGAQTEQSDANVSYQEKGQSLPKRL